MKTLFAILAATLMLSLPAGMARAQDDTYYEPSIEDVAPESGGQLLDSEAASGYAAEEAIDNEDASWAAGAPFDGSSTDGMVQDPGTLEPAGMTITPNE
ncbi:MAG: hypothetical protein HY370_06290 [Proteobacteria bacterium]|nr:hypothetical protein [Pseudomonadota bacterium]